MLQNNNYGSLCSSSNFSLALQSVYTWNRTWNIEDYRPNQSVNFSGMIHHLLYSREKKHQTIAAVGIVLVKAILDAEKEWQSSPL